MLQPPREARERSDRAERGRLQVMLGHLFTEFDLLQGDLSSNSDLLKFLISCNGFLDSLNLRVTYLLPISDNR
jgi:hypothetical protein